MQEELIIEDRKYKCYRNETGDIVSISRYNDKTKMWIKINFGAEDGNHIRNYIEEILKSELIHTVQKKLKTLLQ
ncbi:hypothetical protein [Paenibacillus tyrfis]|uniref:hypothetical protein n=1 Tax=Paenibacillus tyrfis TaxID=1501230 RepID=UPI0020A21857|nr:hypothetical protein [Paenibacillus tyrfis]MCP1312685.1 hypothetical protein [Paenibacillus tyrfis]